MVLPQKAMHPLQKSVRPSAFPPRGICHSWRVIGGNDNTFPRPKQAGILVSRQQRGFWEVEVLRAGVQGLTGDVRHETRAETRRRETMRRCGFANVSSSHVSARLSSIVSRPRAHALSASGGHVRGTSIIAICVAAIPFVTPRRSGGGLCAREYQQE